MAEIAFMIDPKISKDVKTITLSYTFFEVGGGKTPAAPTAGATQLSTERAREARLTTAVPKPPCGAP